MQSSSAFFFKKTHLLLHQDQTQHLTQTTCGNKFGICGCYLTFRTI